MPFCLTAEAKRNFLSALKDGTLDLEKLSTQSSEDTRAEFTKIVGPSTAKELNLLFEQKLLLKDTERAMISFINESTGINAQDKAEHIAKVQAELQRKKDRLYNPGEKEKVLTEILNSIEDKRISKEKSKLATKYFKGQESVSLQEMEQITKLSKAVSDAKENVTVNNKASQVAYGKALLNLNDYTTSLVTGKSSLKENILNGLGLVRVFKVGLDMATPFVQGKKSIGTKEWRNAFITQLYSMVSKSKSRNFKAAILGDPDYELLKSTTLRLSSLTTNIKNREEQFMTSWASKIPVLAGLERGAEDFSTALRFYTAKNILMNARQAGVDVSKGSEALNGIAHAINIVTRSANFGKNDKFGSLAPLANNFMWSSRGVYSELQIWNPVQYAKLPSTARNYMFKRLIASNALVMGLVGLAVFLGLDVETDPTSSLFLQIPIGKNSYFDPTFGSKSYVNFLARMAPSSLGGRKYKASSGVKYDIDAPYSPVNVDSTTIDFFRNKLANTAALVADNLWWRSNTLGQKLPYSKQIMNAVTPMGIESGAKLGTDMGWGASSLFWSFLSMGGISTNTYSKTTDWSQSTSKELQQLHDKIGDEKFTQANDEYNTKLETKLNELKSNPSYQNLSDEDKTAVLSGIKDNIQKDLFKQYHFKYQEPRTTREQDAQKRTNTNLIKQFSK